MRNETELNLKTVNVVLLIVGVALTLFAFACFNKKINRHESMIEALTDYQGLVLLKETIYEEMGELEAEEAFEQIDLAHLELLEVAKSWRGEKLQTVDAVVRNRKTGEIKMARLEKPIGDPAARWKKRE
jgi:hypothetical protein